MLRSKQILVQQIKILFITSSQVFGRNQIFCLFIWEQITKIQKAVATVEEMDNERKIKLGFYSIIGREDPDKTDEIVTVNDRLLKYCLSKGLLFVDNSNIDASCLNRGKLHQNRQGTSILADSFRKSLVNSG